MTTLAQIAKAAGVSPAVVSRLLNGDKTLRISDATRERVLGLVKEMDYTPNAAAKSLRSAKSGLFALVVHDVSNPVYAEIIRGAQQAAAKHNKALLLGDASGGSASVERVVELINGGGLDGLILQAQGDAADRVLANAAKRSIPAVLMQADIDDESHLLSLPDEAAAALATEHLLELGHRAVACMCTARGLIFSKNRQRGWEAALRRSGVLPRPELLVWSPPTLADGAESVRRLMEQAPELTAIVCCNVVSAIGAVGALQQMGVSVPGDVSVVALHDIELNRYLNPPMTAVALPLLELGRAAVDFLSDGGGRAPSSRVITEPAPKLIVRASTARR